MWGVPVDHEYFKQTTSIQWLWYLYNFTKDREENFTTQRNLLEYHAAFFGPEAANTINKIRKDRNQNSPNSNSDREFAATVKSLFGRDLILPGQSPEDSKMEIADVGSLLDRVSSYQEEQEAMREKSKFNFRYWTDIELE